MSPNPLVSSRFSATQDQLFLSFRDNIDPATFVDNAIVGQLPGGDFVVASSVEEFDDTSITLNLEGTLANPGIVPNTGQVSSIRPNGILDDADDGQTNPFVGRAATPVPLSVRLIDATHAELTFSEPVGATNPDDVRVKTAAGQGKSGVAVTAGDHTEVVTISLANAANGLTAGTALVPSSSFQSMDDDVAVASRTLPLSEP